MEYIRPYLYPKQRDAFFLPIRYIFTEASTKAGKTVGAIAWILEEAFAGQHGMNYWWVAPVSSQAEIAYRRIKNRLTPGSFTHKDSPTPVITLINGAMVWFKSGDNPDSLFGEDVHAAVVDEASRCKEESWHALRSTLTATQGKVRAIGNVKGKKNWFYRLARVAQQDQNNPNSNMAYTKITVIDAIEAGIIPPDELEDARRTLPEAVFRELYMAEASDDGGNPFGVSHIANCIRRLSERPPVAFGVDLAKKQDWTVVIGLDAEGDVCVFQRWQRVPWPDTIRRIQDIVGEDIPALVDSTGIGDPILETGLQIGHGNFKGFQFTQAAKQRLMEGLAVSIQSHEIHFPDGVIPNELESFEYEYTRTGVKYSAPSGLNDDCVAALALARQQWAEVAPAQNLMEFYATQAREAKHNHETQIENDDNLSIGQQFVRELSREGFENELTELYRSTLKQYEPAETTCFRCREAVGSTKISDGTHVWHESCYS